jgi:TRAP-type mannitol/chloroaromatic compound transport system substrate-binding protein
MSKQFNRKQFFKGLAIGTIALPFGIRALRPTHAQTTEKSIGYDKKFKWKMVTTWPPNFPVLGEGCVYFADWVREMSGGRLDIQVYGGGELVPPLEVFDTVRSGAAQIGHGASYYWAGKLPSAQFFASVPFGLNAQQLNAWLISGGGLQLWEELYADYGLIPLPGGNTGVQMGGWYNREINTVEDLRGLKMRMPGVGGKVLERAGGSPVLLAGGEIYTGLERGIIDAAEWIGPYHDYKMGFQQIAKYYYTPGWHELGTELEIMINQQAFEELPSDLKAIVRSAAYRLNHWVLSEFEARNSEYLVKIQESEGVEIRRFNDKILETLRIYADEAIADLAQSDAFSKKTYESFKTFKKNMSKWSSVSEKVYYQDIEI